MSGLALFTIFHTLISIAAMFVGLFLLYGFLQRQRMPRLTLWALGLLAATTITGFLFPIHGFTPALGTGIVSTVLLILAFAARYRFAMAGVWRSLYVVSAVVALYLDWFVAVVQAFVKVPLLHGLAPTGSEPPFVAAQAVVLLAFVIAGYFSVRRFRFGLMASGI
ncbi:MAG: hypothetical protein P4L57_00275 [Rhizomicrobium sp.]|nr:hypothetical protein [Rhizomicrobium sp.]